MRGCSCGETLRSNDRYCRSCGRQAIEPVRGRSRWLVALGLVALVGLGWLLFRTPSPDAQADESADEAALEDDPDFEPVADGRLGPLEGDDSPASDPEADQAAEDSADAVAFPTRDSVDGGPLVGEPTGLGLIVGGALESLRIVSLDTGEEQEFPDVSGWPIGSVGTELILQTDRAVATFDLAAPEQGLQDLVVAEDVNVGWVWMDGDVIWLIVADRESPFPNRALAYTVDGSLVDELELASGIRSFLWRSTSDLLFNEAAGIFRRSDSGLEQLSTGVPVAIGEETVLVHVCDDVLECTTSLHDRETWEQRRYDHTPGDPLTMFINIAGDDRWVVSTDLFGGATSLASLDTGEVLQEFDVSLDAGPDVALAFSPDGRWFIRPGAGDEKIVDLEQRRVWLTGLIFPPDVGRLLVDLTGTAFEG